VGSSVQPVSGTEVVATVKVARSVLRTSFTTRNTLVQDRTITMNLEEGPFRSLTGEWRFEPIGDEGSRVSFRVNFEFDNRLMAAALNAAFESVCATMVSAFVERARAVYG
jgi:ribosome-associated toxin RatA of RatAB toxin-antitoxin module